jgi:geranylgeranyl reductase
MIAPSGNAVSMPVGNGYVGLVDRDQFDEWLRDRAADSGATRITGTFEGVDRESDGMATVRFRPKGAARGSQPESIRTRLVIGADGANSAVARTELPKSSQPPFVAAYHEVIESPPEGLHGFEGGRCDVFYQGNLSPDFYAWIFPHGPHSSIGVGSAKKGFPLREAVAELRQQTGLDQCQTVRVEGAPIPLKPRKRWDNGRDVVLAGDAAGVVAPASGEGIYYAMLGGRLAADAAIAFLRTGDARELSGARKRFMKEHGKVFWVLGIMQYFWYRNDKRRESFVKMCADKDVQRLTWESYTEKKMVRSDPMAHVRIFLKDMGHLLGIVRPT